MSPTTSDGVLGSGPAVSAAGWRPLRALPGERHTGAPVSGALRAQSVGALVHLSDLHLCDAESPARQTHLDRHGDPGAPCAGLLGSIGTYRPQELLTVQVAVSAVTAVGALRGAPVSGGPLDAVIVTGDVTDNAQRNELAWYLQVMGGGVVSPRSGGMSSSWVGGPAAPWSPHHWHPEGPPDGVPPDLATSRYGYPVIRGLVEAARADVTSPGLPLPWLSVHGNHDALLQGTVPASPELAAMAVGGQRVVDLSPGQTPLVVLEGVAPVGPARYTHDAAAPTTPVDPDPARALLEPGDFAAAHLPGPADPWSADHAPARRSGNQWAHDVAGLRVIALDTVNPHGGWQGSLDDERLAWLEEQLLDARGRYTVVASHHPSWCLTNAYAPAGAPPRRLADEVLSTLLRAPHVVAWVAGHVHGHRHLWHPAPGGRSGLWEVTTASLVDWPQQFRVLEVLRRPGGTLGLASTVVDHAAPAVADTSALGDPLQLAALSRTLAANDYRLREDPARRGHLTGGPGDRNAVWWMPDPLS